MDNLNIKTRTTFISIMVFILILSIGQSSASIVYTDNNADSDSDIDSSTNISNTGVTDYTDAQTLDGSDQEIQEINTGAGLSLWSYYKTIEIDATKVSADLTNFPVLISMFDSDLKTKAQADGGDIAFFDLGGNQLPHEVEIFDQVTNATHAEFVGWVKANLSSTVNTKIIMRYGNSTMVDQENPTQVWSSDYNNIWHLNNNPTQTAPQIDDSTGNNDGNSTGGMTSGDQVAGQVGTSLDFDGVDDITNMGTISSNSWDALTVSAWVNRDTIDDARVFSIAPTTAVADSIFA
ncbi:MAG: DUF2341 domain-containing protein, partial [Candidatus Heimdallarchaeota archaeon]|nr:DUF2341 domain-containing protein [Candidatus Heimdallarchaeota archaeon]